MYVFKKNIEEADLIFVKEKSLTRFSGRTFYSLKTCIFLHKQSNNVNCKCIKGKNCPADTKESNKVQLKDIKCVAGKNCPCKKGVNCPCTKGKDCPTESNLKQKGDDFLKKLVVPKGLDPTGRVKKTIEDMNGKKTTCTEGIDCPCKPGVDCPCIDGIDCPVLGTPLAMDKCKPGVDCPCNQGVDCPCVPGID